MILTDQKRKNRKAIDAYSAFTEDWDESLHFSYCLLGVCAVFLVDTPYE